MSLLGAITPLQEKYTRDHIIDSILFIMQSFISKSNTKYPMQFITKVKIPFPSYVSAEYNECEFKCQIINGKLEGKCKLKHSQEGISELTMNLHLKNGILDRSVEYNYRTQVDMTNISGKFNNNTFTGTYKYIHFERTTVKIIDNINCEYVNGILQKYESNNLKIVLINRYYHVTEQNLKTAQQGGPSRRQFTMTSNIYVGLREEFNTVGDKICSLTYSEQGKPLNGFIKLRGFCKHLKERCTPFYKIIHTPSKQRTYDYRITDDLIVHYTDGQLTITGPKTALYFDENEQITHGTIEEYGHVDVYENGYRVVKTPETELYYYLDGTISHGYEAYGYDTKIFYENGKKTRKTGPNTDIYYDDKNKKSGYKTSDGVKTIYHQGQITNKSWSNIYGSGNIVYKNGQIDFTNSWQNDKHQRSLTLDEGEIFVWKLCKQSLSNYVYVKLRVPKEARRIPFIINSDKSRVEFAIVEEIIEIYTGKQHKVAQSCVRTDKITYKLGEKVTPDNFDPDASIECSYGINVHKYQDACRQWMKLNY